MKRIIRLISAIIVIALATGCGSASSEAEPELPTTIPPLTDYSQVDLPLQRYVLTPQEVALYDNAVTVLANDCAKRFGITDSPYIPNLTPMPNEAVLFDGRYGTVIDPEKALQFGVAGDPADRAGSMMVDDEKGSGPSIGSSRDPTEFEYEVFHGVAPSGDPATVTDEAGDPVPPGGCLQEGALELFDGTTDYYRTQVLLISGGLGESRDQIMVDSRYVSALAQWSECMSEVGYDVADLHEMGDFEVAEGDAGRQATFESVSCGQEVNLYGTWYALDQAYQQRFIDERAAEFETAQREVLAALERSREILGQ
ncbi:MAG: hypothetical protein ACK5KO_12350 [Arachnia sp.]